MNALSKLALLSLFAATALCAQQPAVKPATQPPAVAPKPAEKLKTAPAISDAQKAKFFKAQSEMVQAQAQAQQAAQASQAKTTAYQAVVSDLQANTCGKDANLLLDLSGDPACVEKPKPADAPKK